MPYYIIALIHNIAVFLRLKTIANNTRGYYYNEKEGVFYCRRCGGTEWSSSEQADHCNKCGLVVETK